MEVKVDQEIDIQNEEKAPLPIVIVDEEEKVILRKVDVHLTPLMLVTYMLQYLDKITSGKVPLP
ncbi:hypothetical protein NA56DRAFT_712277 [Hyaloscypha hepaticicola]|uniref:Uncharacterized protein n=1 Tax=Hyaloscypha hepaticicola TaxID=2082293 RepID=A0A2J6PGR5_9HELO|nr:hypothetical protein NA56DRAFT_712277 [Hyaloscypha hepaticicola]